MAGIEEAPSQAERRLRAERERYRALVEAIPDPVMHLDRDLALRFANPAARELLGDGSDPEHMVWEPDDAAEAQRVVDAVFAEGTGRSFETPLRIAGEDRWLEVSVVPDLGDDGTVEGITTISRDVTHRKETEHELTRRVLEDQLTGLANRTRFELELDRALGTLDRHRSPIAVLFLDLDRFKEINDRHGHQHGDRFLWAVARRLEDTVRHGDLVARFGGDEFAIMPRRLGSEAEADALAKRIHATLGELARRSEGDPTVGSASIGLAFAHRAGEVSAGELVRRADEAMYRAKRAGRHRTERWQD